ncbi:hypothetical protein FN846DRAFT_908467 [Sphaerosporella brunnea]|uniref:Uncharacterized protein n=1 Tax=Sphaerosporella brunnea TaxID=1250544 RepID=A0A5J5ETP8_9PEZI|nr:hypothetical protein FN846DRAFT_908467 [Sphaerosporella brunnea]
MDHSPSVPVLPAVHEVEGGPTLAPTHEIHQRTRISRCHAMTGFIPEGLTGDLWQSDCPGEANRRVRECGSQGNSLEDKDPSDLAKEIADSQVCGARDRDVVRAVAVTRCEPEISAVTQVLSNPLQQYSRPPSTEGVTHEQTVNYKLVLREVDVAWGPADVMTFTRMCGDAYLRRNNRENVAQPAPANLLRHLLSDQTGQEFVKFARGEERKVRDMISLIEDRPPPISHLLQDIDAATVGDTIEAFEARVRHHKLGSRRMKNMLEFALGVRMLRPVSDDDRAKSLHQHVSSINP